MNSRDLTGMQVKELCDRIAPIADYLGRLKTRTHDLEFPRDDELRVCAEDAHSAVNALRLKLHGLYWGETPRAARKHSRNMRNS